MCVMRKKTTFLLVSYVFYVLPNVKEALSYLTA